jgi:hypothetical protein
MPRAWLTAGEGIGCVVVIAVLGLAIGAAGVALILRY